MVPVDGKAGAVAPAIPLLVLCPSHPSPKAGRSCAVRWPPARQGGAASHWLSKTRAAAAPPAPPTPPTGAGAGPRGAGPWPRAWAGSGSGPGLAVACLQGWRPTPGPPAWPSSPYREPACPPMPPLPPRLLALRLPLLLLLRWRRAARRSSGRRLPRAGSPFGRGGRRCGRHTGQLVGARRRLSLPLAPADPRRPRALRHGGACRGRGGRRKGDGQVL